VGRPAKVRPIAHPEDAIEDAPVIDMVAVSRFETPFTQVRQIVNRTSQLGLSDFAF
jgi:hypothetical protein